MTRRQWRPCSAGGGAVDGGTSTNTSPAVEPAASVATTTTTTTTTSSCITIAGVECRPVIVSALNLTVLEASAQAQVMLVEAALDERGIDDNDVSSRTLPSGDPYGMVVWPAAVSLAQYLIGGNNSNDDDRTSTSTSGKRRDLSTVRVWEVGSGTGVVSIAAARHGAKSVYATDYEALTLQLLEHAAYQMNGISPTQLSTGLWNIVTADEKDNDVSMTTSSSPLPSLPPADLLVAADVLYEFRTGRGLADLAIRALRVGMDVLVADSPGRPGRPVFLDRVNQSLKVPVAFTTIPGLTITEARHDLICGVGSTTISETPKPLPIALLELHPAMLKED